MAKKELIVSSEGLEKLKQELEELKTVRRQEIAEKIETARAFGDLSENSEYDEAKNEQAKVAARIAELEDLIASAEIIDESELKADIINLGSTITLFDCDMEEEIEYSIVGTNEADPMKGRISDRSPIGSAMMGKRAGETVEVTTPGGEIKFKILKVERTKGTN